MLATGRQGVVPVVAPVHPEGQLGEVYEADFGRLGMITDAATGRRKAVWAGTNQRWNEGCPRSRSVSVRAALATGWLIFAMEGGADAWRGCIAAGAQLPRGQLIKIHQPALARRRPRHRIRTIIPPSSSPTPGRLRMASRGMPLCGTGGGPIGPPARQRPTSRVGDRARAQAQQAWGGLHRTAPAKCSGTSNAWSFTAR